MNYRFRRLALVLLAPLAIFGEWFYWIWTGRPGNYLNRLLEWAGCEL